MVTYAVVLAAKLKASKINVINCVKRKKEETRKFDQKIRSKNGSWEGIRSKSKKKEELFLK